MSISKHDIGVCVNHPDVTLGEQFTVERYGEALRDIARHGFKAIEYSHVPHLTAEESRRVGEITRELGMRPWSVHSEHLNAPDEPSIETYFRIQRTCAVNARQIGCGVAVFHPPNTDLSWDHARRIVKRVADIFQDQGVKAAIENVPERRFEHQATGALHRLVGELDHPNLGFTIDTGHARLFGPDEPVNTIRLFGHKILTTHLHDNYGQADGHQPPGLGVINWRNVLSALNEAGYQGPLLVELTASSVKARRTTQVLRDLPLEVERTLSIGYLQFLKQEIP